MTKRTITILAAILTMASLGHGQIVFENKLVEIESAPDAELLTAEFPFTVKGDQPVTIAEYEAACGCLEAQISDGGKLTWMPGEKGVVKGLFKMGTFKGTVDKLIVLRMKGTPHPEKLTVRVHIPILLEMDPPTLFWDQGAKVTPQTFKLKVHHKKPIHILDVSGTNEQFDFEVKKIKDGWEYEIEVTPKTLETRAFGLLRIKTDCEFKRHQSYQGFAVIRRAVGN